MKMTIIPRIKLCIDESWLIMVKFIIESIYWHGAGNISSRLNRLLQEVPGCASAINLTISFCNVKIFPLLEQLPQKIIPYFIIEWKHGW